MKADNTVQRRDEEEEGRVKVPMEKLNSFSSSWGKRQKMSTKRRNEERESKRRVDKG